MQADCTLEVFSKTDRGRLRPVNEDCVFASATDGLLIVADGMGGHAGGEVASGIAVRVAARVLKDSLPHAPAALPVLARQLLTEACRRADTAIREREAADPALAGMGTTIVIAACRGSQVAVAHAGDSRAYLLHAGQLRRLTEDHTLVRRLVETGAISESAARYHNLRNVITRCLGGQEYIDPDVRLVDWAPGDLLLLCTDGLTGMLEDAEIEDLLRDRCADLSQCGQALIDLANERGGTDNITVALGRYKEDVR